MPYVAHLCSSSKLGCRGAERPSAAQRRGAPKRRAAPRGAPRSTVVHGSPAAVLCRSICWVLALGRLGVAKKSEEDLRPFSAI